MCNNGHPTTSNGVRWDGQILNALVGQISQLVPRSPHGGFSQGGFDYFRRFEALRARLAEILACPVDLVEEPVETARLQKQIDEDRVLAF